MLRTRLPAVLAGVAWLAATPVAFAEDPRAAEAAARAKQVLSDAPASAEVEEPRYALVAPKEPAAVLQEGEPGSASGEEGSVSLATQLSNPVAALISVPFQFNLDNGFGKDDAGYRVFLNFQPVIPFSISRDWNLISRTILPVVHQHDLFPGAGDQDGLGDVVQSLFFSPKLPNSWGLIWGAGPVFLLPTATEELLGAEKWGAGPTAVALRQSRGWTVGILANHIWSFADAGDSDRPDVNNTFLQPFVTFTTQDAWTFSLNSESTYNWESEAWSIPFNAVVSRLIRVGKLPVSVGAGVRYWAESPEGGPEGWGLRLVVTFLFPKRR